MKLSFDNVKVGDVLLLSSSHVAKYKIIRKEKYQSDSGFYTIKSLRDKSAYYFVYTNRELNSLWKLQPRTDEEFNALDYI